MRRKFTFLSLLFVLAGTTGFAQFSLTGTPYTQNFNTLANTGTSSTLPTGWLLSEAGGNTLYSAGDGSSNTGDTKSYGSTGSTERAFGTLQGGGVVPTIGVGFTNNTGMLITLINLVYRGEQWRRGSGPSTDRLDFQYSLNATSLTTGTWTDVNTLDFISPRAGSPSSAVDGNGAGNFTNINASIGGLSIPNGATFYLRWVDFTVPSGNDDGLAIDDLTMNLTLSAPLPVKLTDFTGIRNGKTIDLGWTTTSEENSQQFEVERSADGSQFIRTGTVAAAGESGSPIHYNFSDATPHNGNNFYRLRMVDRDGRYEYSKVIKIYFGVALAAVPNPARGTVLVNNPENTTALFRMLDSYGRVVKQQLIPGNSVNYPVSLAAVQSGIYVVQLKSDKETTATRLVVSQ